MKFFSSPLSSILKTDEYSKFGGKMNIQKKKIKEESFMNDVLERLERNYLEPPEDRRKVVCKCSACDEPIYEGDDVYELMGFMFCQSCVDDAHSYAELDY